MWGVLGLFLFFFVLVQLDSLKFDGAGGGVWMVSSSGWEGVGAMATIVNSPPKHKTYAN